MSQPTQTIRVALAERAYSIAIGSATLGDVGPFLRQFSAAESVVLITDANVLPLHGRAVADSLTNSGATVHTIAIEPGEQAKCAAVAESLWQRMLELGADRKTVVAALGGGVVGDLAGFVAATYARGIGLLQIPTTLLAQVDSSVGGKVGINLPGAKNMVGAFWQPLGVLIDTDTLATLPRREFVSGLAEVVKYGVIPRRELSSPNSKIVQPRSPSGNPQCSTAWWHAAAGSKRMWSKPTNGRPAAVRRN